MDIIRASGDQYLRRYGKPFSPTLNFKVLEYFKIWQNISPPCGCGFSVQQSVTGLQGIGPNAGDRNPQRFIVSEEDVRVDFECFEIFSIFSIFKSGYFDASCETISVCTPI